MHKCKDCPSEADDRYTMDFSDVEPGAKIYWCSVCGPGANELNDLLCEKIKEEPGFAEKLEEAIAKEERKIN